MEDIKFELLEKDRNRRIVTFEYKGPYLIVDNVYLSWSTTIPPLKWTADNREVHWSKWLESLQKDERALLVFWKVVGDFLRQESACM